MVNKLKKSAPRSEKSVATIVAKKQGRFSNAGFIIIFLKVILFRESLGIIPKSLALKVLL